MRVICCTLPTCEKVYKNVGILNPIQRKTDEHIILSHKSQLPSRNDDNVIITKYPIKSVGVTM